MARHPLQLRATPRQGHRQRWPSPVRVGVLVLTVLLGALVTSRPAPAAEFACAAGDVVCLIEAITMANANGEANIITLEAGTYTLTAVDNRTNGPNGLPSVTSPLTIQGAGADATIIERDASAPLFRLVHIAAAGTLTLKRLTLQDGNVGLFTGGALGNAGTLTMRRVIVAHNRSGFFGGGLSNQGTLRIAQTIFMGNLSLFGGGGIFTTGGTVTITQTTFVNNIADGGGGLEMGEVPPGGGTVAITNSSFVDNNGLFQGGGGLWNAGEVLTLTNTTVARNRADGLFPGGGGLRNSGTTRILHSTFAENSIRFSRAGRAGGISTSSGTVEVQNTILARNTVGTSDQASDCAGPVTSLGHNLIGDPTGCAISLQGTDLTGDPGLDAFTDDGTPGDGHFPLLPTSQAIDAGNDAVCPKRDQLREQRVGPCDIGAIAFRDQDDHHHGEDREAAAHGFQ